MIRVWAGGESEPGWGSLCRDSDKQTWDYQGGGPSAYQEPAGATVRPEDTSHPELSPGWLLSHSFVSVEPQRS